MYSGGASSYNKDIKSGYGNSGYHKAGGNYKKAMKKHHLTNVEKELNEKTNELTDKSLNNNNNNNKNYAFNKGVKLTNADFVLNDEKTNLIDDSTRLEQSECKSNQTKTNNEIKFKEETNLINNFVAGPRLRLNISGKRFEVYESLLERFPDSLLGTKDLRLSFYDKFRDEYFFDRNREAFEGILFFYQSNGRFEPPSFVPYDVFYEEIKFFGLVSYLNSDAKCDEALMLIAFNDLESEIIRKELTIYTEEDLKSLKIERIKLKHRFYTLRHFSDLDDDDENMPKNKFQKFLWLVFERPNTSVLGKIVAFICLITVITSVVVMCLETVVDSNTKPTNSYFKHFNENIDQINLRSASIYAARTTATIASRTTTSTPELSSSLLSSSSSSFTSSNTATQTTTESVSIRSTDFELADKDDLSLTSSERRREFFFLELVCNSLFTVEIVLRIIASPDRIEFLKNFSNIIDIVAVVPFWSTLLLNNIFTFYLRMVGFNDDMNNPNSKQRQSNQYGLSVLRILRLTRVLRILKLSRHIRALHIMGKILYECLYEIILLLTFLAINIVIFSSLMYYIELHALGSSSPFISIPHSFWWAVISFTTIGYGDLIPQSALGKFFGSFFILCGILIALLPVPILSCKFERIYKELSQAYSKRDKY